MNRPQRGVVYSLSEVLCDLELLETACLCFRVQDLCYPENRSTTEQVLIYSHLKDEQLLAMPGWSETQWKFAYETDEWMPVFVAIDDIAVEKLCVIEPLVGRDVRYSSSMWVFPRGAECPQQPVAYVPELHGILEAR